MSEAAKNRLKERGFDAALPGFPREIGGVAVENPIWLAPLAGITFASFRRFHRMMGAGLVHTEMVSALGLIHNGRKTKELLCRTNDEGPCALQLFGAKADDVARGAAFALENYSFEALEINMACPMPKVTKKGSGSKLMEYPNEAAAMMRALKGFGLPVWAKIRVMPGADVEETAAFSERLFEAGADFIFVHGRTPSQRYEGVADRDAVGRIAVRFPGRIGGSGDCYTPRDFEDYLERGCASVLAGRGILRDAFLIAETLRQLGANVPQELAAPTAAAQAEMLIELGEAICAAEGEPLAMTIARRMLGALFKGFPGAAQLRREGAMTKSWGELAPLLRNWRPTELE
ncbi:MAG: tRNA-dihydrouridine synthase family protein [Cloacibacillus sp.]